MKTFIATFLVLFLSLPTAMAGSVAGKGVWCPKDDVIEESFGFWFEEENTRQVFLKGYVVSTDDYNYEEETTVIVIGGLGYKLNRRTLKLVIPEKFDRQCYLATSYDELVAKLEDISTAAEAKNQI